MTEDMIVELFWRRDESAIAEVEKRFGKLIYSICFNFLGNREDSEECQNTVYARLWDNIPPARPSSLKAYLIRVAETVSYNRRDRDRSKRRIPPGQTSPLDDFSDFLADGHSLDDELDSREVTRAINSFIHRQPKLGQRIFVLRYFYQMSVASIAEDIGKKPGYVRGQLGKMKETLRAELTERGLLP